jgi:hypothetical protein
MIVIGGSTTNRTTRRRCKSEQDELDVVSWVFHDETDSLSASESFEEELVAEEKAWMSHLGYNFFFMVTKFQLLEKGC